MKRSLFAIVVFVMLFCMVSATSVFAESSEAPTLNVDIDTGEMTVIPVEYYFASGITPWGGEEVDKLFDGLYGVPSDDATIGLYYRTDEEKGTKLGGLVTDDLVTVTFSTAENATVNYYTFYTGFDTALESDRNPTAWTLYGLDDEGNWQIVHQVESTDTVSTGLEPLNCTPYTYMVPAENVGVYMDYMIEFTADGEYFQLNEIVLFGELGGEIASGDDPEEDAADEPVDDPADDSASTTTAAPSATTDSNTDDAGFPVVPIVIAAVAMIAVAVVVVIVVLKKKKG